jgi:hypothetical protein
MIIDSYHNNAMKIALSQQLNGGNQMQTTSKEIQSFIAFTKMIGKISMKKNCFEDEREFCLSACENCESRALARAYTMPTDF